MLIKCFIVTINLVMLNNFSSIRMIHYLIYIFADLQGKWGYCKFYKAITKSFTNLSTGKNDDNKIQNVFQLMKPDFILNIVISKMRP